jgi:nucleotide-binding universal stress UspA family protein
MSDIKRILVPVDFSEPSDGALDRAIEMAKELGAEIHLLNVLDVPPQLRGTQTTMPDAWAEMRDTARQELDKRLRRVRAKRVRAHGHFEEGYPAARVIAHQAEELGADLIVMGSVGGSRLVRVLLGSVADRTLRLAKCPVMIVKPEPEPEGEPEPAKKS